ncbi:MAG: ATP-dependent DNA helicase RecG [Lachnospiraceae bacterium]|nr:ATP-dependent DNA helicase RecG [Lachnospiraceae bacterium]
MEDLRNIPLTALKGIGPSRAEMFLQVGVSNAEELLFYFPRSYLDQSRVTFIEQGLQQAKASGEEGAEVLLRARVVSDPKNFHKGRFTITNARLEDESGAIGAVWFNQPYLMKNLVKGGEYLVQGKIKRSYNRWELSSPKLQRLVEGAPILPLLPVYPLGAGLTQKILRSAVEKVLSVLEEGYDPLPAAYRQQFMPRTAALKAMHLPPSFEEAERARERLAFDELFVQQMALKQQRRRRMDQRDGVVLPGSLEKEQAMMDSLPFRLTGAQQRAWEEIREDLASKGAMNRLLQGDVGSGKTLVAFLAMYRCFLSGKQCALMAPTEVLATQHALEAEKVLEPLGMKVALLSGNVKGKERRQILEGLEQGTIHALIGTHALISDPVTWKDLGLVITDEQHRFGVRQRMALSRKGEKVNVLVMTATPIPRTLAMILYGDMDVSLIDEMPPGRTPIRTYSVDSGYDERIYRFMRKQTMEGHQVYVICALVEEEDKSKTVSEAEDELLPGHSVELRRRSEEQEEDFSEEQEELKLRSAVGYADFLQRIVFPDLKVGLLHGRMKAQEKESVMTAYARGDIQILVSTTVVEVGVNVPNATLMVVENAERFGLAQLHQLRGRVGRGEAESYCVLVSDSRSRLTRQRMKTMCDSTDGFYIAEEDLRLRGAGDIFGLRQHGLPDLKVADLYRDKLLLKEAQRLAETVLDADPDLEQMEHLGIREEMEAFWERASARERA